MAPHAREQQLMSHWTAPLGQFVPATLQLPAPLPPGAPQRPFGWPTAFTQSPLQHWAFCEHTSPCCAQYETAAEHTPPLQKPEQQLAFVVHPLPEVVHPVPPSDAHLPAVHTPLQHWLPEVHAPATGLSGTHAVAEHVRLTQKPVQQSDAAMHAEPTIVHAPPPVGLLHTLAVGTPQTPPLGQVAPLPHLMRPPHPSGTKPQLNPVHAMTGSAGWHTTPPPHTLGTPPPPQT
jgi:hypothetical protein